MSFLKKVGFFFELSLPNPIEVLRPICRESPHFDEEKILAYLESGATYGAMPLVDEDVLAHPPEIIGSVHVQTDGVWAWPNTLTYYIRRYHIALPQNFVAHMAMNERKCPTNSDVSGLMLEGEIAMKEGDHMRRPVLIVVAAALQAERIDLWSGEWRSIPPAHGAVP